MCNPACTITVGTLFTSCSCGMKHLWNVAHGMCNVTYAVCVYEIIFDAFQPIAIPCKQERRQRNHHAVEMQLSLSALFQLQRSGVHSNKNGVIQWSTMTFHAVILSSRMYQKEAKNLQNPFCCIVFVTASNLTNFQPCVKQSFVNGRISQTEEDLFVEQIY